MKKSSAWIENWTIFYWGWWISWSPFVGTFIARISKGRTIKEFIFWSCISPNPYLYIFGLQYLVVPQFIWKCSNRLE